MAQKMGLPQVALQQLISRTALDNEADRLGLTTPDADLAFNVRSMAAFRGPLGTFDRPSFLAALQNAQYSEDQFLAEVRQDMTRDQLTQAVEADFLVPSTYAQALFQFLNEKRAADYVILSPDQVGSVAPPSDAVLAAYVKDHPGRYSTPEYRDVDYAVITPADEMGSSCRQRRPDRSRNMTRTRRPMSFPKSATSSRSSSRPGRRRPTPAPKSTRA